MRLYKAQIQIIKEIKQKSFPWRRFVIINLNRAQKLSLHTSIHPFFHSSVSILYLISNVKFCMICSKNITYFIQITEKNFFSVIYIIILWRKKKKLSAFLCFLFNLQENREHRRKKRNFEFLTCGKQFKIRIVEILFKQLSFYVIEIIKKLQISTLFLLCFFGVYIWKSLSEIKRGANMLWFFLLQ